MDLFSNLLHFLVIGVLVLPSRGRVAVTNAATSAATTTGNPTVSQNTDPPVIPGPGIPIYDDCVVYHQKACNSSSNQGSPYFIKARNAAGYESNSDICKTENEVPGCRGVGWTFIGTLKNNGLSNYGNELWTAKGSSQTVLNSQFWSASVAEICLTSEVFNIQIPVEAPSLRSLFFDKRILNMTAQHWINSLVVSVMPNFVEGCYEVGFNVGDNGRRARLGIVSISRNGSCPENAFSMIGIGLQTNQSLYHGFFNVYPVQNEEAFNASISIYVRSRHVSVPPSTNQPETTPPETNPSETIQPETTEPETTQPEPTPLETSPPETTLSTTTPPETNPPATVALPTRIPPDSK